MTFFDAHPFLLVGLYFVYSAFVSGMPEPTTTSKPFYQWLYHSLHLLSGDLSYAFGSRLPKAQ